MIPGGRLLNADAIRYLQNKNAVEEERRQRDFELETRRLQLEERQLALSERKFEAELEFKRQKLDVEIEERRTQNAIQQAQLQLISVLVEKVTKSS